MNILTCYGCTKFDIKAKKCERYSKKIENIVKCPLCNDLYLSKKP